MLDEMSDKPRLIKPEKMGKPSGRSVFGGIYIGIKGKGDANTNEILYRALTDANISTEYEGKDYKGEPVDVWKVTSEFIKMFYKKQYDFNLRFVVYEEINSTFQLFTLLDPVMRKKAKQARYLKSLARKK